MQITSNDFNLLTTLNRVGYMTSKQIEKTFFNSYTYCMERLKMLENDNYIKASPLLYRQSNVYWLNKKGIEIIGDNKQDINKRCISPLIPHYLSCADFYLAIRNKLDIEEYNTEFNVDFTHNGRIINFRPDIYTRLNDKNYLVEIDNKEQKHLIAKKVKVYEAFASTKEYKKYFDLYPRVLIVSNAAERIKPKIEEVKELSLNFMLTEFHNLENIDKAIWLKTGKKERCKLWD